MIYQHLILNFKNDTKCDIILSRKEIDTIKINTLITIIA